MSCRLLTLLALAGSALTAAAQPPATTPTKLTVRPAGPPDPALHYRLLPEVMDQTPGNAALLYQRSHSPEWLGYQRQKDFYKQLEEALKMPLKEVAGTPVVGWANSRMLTEVDLAARREHCDWEMTERFKKEGFGMLLPDVHWFREVANLLALRARLELAEGDFDKAAHTLQTGFALARHLNDSPLLIVSLVGMGVGHAMTDRLEELLQQPGVPNLYWALTNLPRPFFDLRKPLEGEKAMLEGLFREVLGERRGRESLAGSMGLRGFERRTIRADPRRLNADELQGMVDDLYAVSALAREGPAGPFGRLPVLATAVKNYPQAREALIARGRKAEEVDALPVLQVVALDSLHHFRHHRDEMYKWFGLPYPEARAGLEEAMRRLAEAGNRLECFPALLDLLPAVGKVHSTSVRFDRRVAALRCVEAIRLHAAAHDGKLPATLGAITAVPVPLDPMTGKEFTYQTAGGKATVYGPPPPGETAYPHNTVRYEITLER